MTDKLFNVAAFLCLICLPIAATAELPVTPGREEASRTEQARATPAEEQRHAALWGLKMEEWARYRELMRGPLGILSPGLDPLTALGIEARDDTERRRYAELQARFEAIRVEKLLAFQRAYDEAFQRIFAGLPRIGDEGRLAVFVKDNCPPCEKKVGQLQAAGSTFDLYFVDSKPDDARLRAWAKKAGVDPAKVSSRTITLNHDGGRWKNLGLSGGLPAAVREENGRWVRLP
ncbi:MAG: TIGR03759 family integrating conjugative element protein [Betaproteobacteria bacterium]|nr:TIGR03759 family integrating conjugative element protein [Betaproteobacteria bacterium]